MNLGFLRQFRSLVPIRLEYRIRDELYSLLPVRHRSRYENIFDCCVWKTASQWIRVVLSDPAVYQYSGLRTLHFTQSPLIRKGHGREVHFPLRRIISPVYCSYEAFAALSSAANQRTFFVMRDPRDVMVSQYFSKRYSHRLNDNIEVVPIGWTAIGLD